MSKYIAWDTETSGIPYTRSPCSRDNLYKWDNARIVSLAIVVFDERGCEIETQYIIARPDGFKLGEHVNPECTTEPRLCSCCDHTGATHVHKITNNKANMEGLPFKHIYNVFMSMVKKYDIQTLVAHNSQFDENMFISECIRYNLSLETFHTLHKVCTIHMSKMHFLPTKNKKLPTIYTYLFNRGFLEHHALFDARACGEIYHQLRKHTFSVQAKINIDKITIPIEDVPVITGYSNKDLEVVARPIIAYNKLLMQTRREYKYIEKILKQDFINYLLTEYINKYDKIPISDISRKIKSIRFQIVNKTKLSEVDTEIILNYFENILYAKHVRTKNNEKFKRCEKVVCVIKGTKYELSGIIGEVTDDNNKTTVKKNYINDDLDELKDNIIAQTYMFLLGIDEFSFDVIGRTIYKRDTRLWNGIIEPNLVHFFNHIHRSLAR